MSNDRVIDKVLVEWGDQLFRRRRQSGDEGGGRQGSGARGRSGLAGRAGSDDTRMSASAVRSALRDAMRPGARQVVVKITGGGKGMKAMAAHARYISRQGKEVAGGAGRTLDVIDERGERHRGASAIRQLMEDWRTSGSYIPEESHRKEAFHIIFSMPRDTRAEALQEAVSETAARLFDGHRYAMVMHLDQGAPHVHVMVRAERMDGKRLNPRKADLDHWRATFARELQARGIDAIATRQVARLRNRAQPQLWEIKARADGRLQRSRASVMTSDGAVRSRAQAVQAWREVTRALAASPSAEDRRLAIEAVSYLARALGGSDRSDLAQRLVARPPKRDDSDRSR